LDAELKKSDVWVEMEGVQNCKEIAGKWSMMPEFRKQSFVSHNQGSGCVEKICFCMREINAILWSCGIFGRFNPSWVLSWKLTQTWALATDALEPSLAMCPEMPQKRQMLLLS